MTEADRCEVIGEELPEEQQLDYDINDDDQISSDGTEEQDNFGFRGTQGIRPNLLINQETKRFTHSSKIQLQETFPRGGFP